MVDILLLEFANDNKRSDNKNKKEEKPEQEQNKEIKKAG